MTEKAPKLRHFKCECGQEWEAGDECPNPDECPECETDANVKEVTNDTP